MIDNGFEPLGDCMKVRNSIFLNVGIIFLALTLTACGGNPKKDGDEASVAVDKKKGAKDGVAAKDGKAGKSGVEVIAVKSGDDVGNGSVIKKEGTKEVAATDLGSTFEPVIFFAYDQYSVDDDALKIIKHYAHVLDSAEKESIILVGHTDERGSPEYNLALGEKRAKAVKEAFMLYGIPSSRMEVVSLGEEQPLVDELNEQAWSKNRRVEIKIK